MRRRQKLERRLFGWMLTLALATALPLVLVGAWIWTNSLEWVGTLGPWDRVAESGRVVFEAASGAAASDPVLADALDRHREELSESLRRARQWEFIGGRVASAVPALAVFLAVLLVWVAWAVSRRVARELARPIADLVGWAGLLAREEPLPGPTPAEAREVDEVRALRAAFRRAASELSLARDRALEAERVRLWGEMARRVAHEMKNPLTPLRLAAHRLARSMDDGGADWAEPIAVIEEETSRLEELAREFAALGRPPEGPTSAVDVVELLTALLDSDVPAGIEATLEAEPELPLVEAHYEALVRTFRNLLRNAVEAMEGMTSPRRIRVRIAAWKDGQGVEVTVADAGAGLPNGVGERIFEPDFTTKSRGTGLGLAIVRQAVVAHGGEIEARNGPDGGAEITVRLRAGEGVVARA